MQRHILATGLEIAEGLEYLHHSDRRMVHRDLSATNILLTTSAADDRGFRALLSDFGEAAVAAAAVCCAMLHTLCTQSSAVLGLLASSLLADPPFMPCLCAAQASPPLYRRSRRTRPAK